MPTHTHTHNEIISRPNINEIISGVIIKHGLNPAFVSFSSYFDFKQPMLDDNDKFYFFFTIHMVFTIHILQVQLTSRLQN